MDLFVICFGHVNSGPTVEILISLDSEKRFNSFSREFFFICSYYRRYLNNIFCISFLQPYQMPVTAELSLLSRQIRETYPDES